jgi:hypothetical protein
MMTAGVSFAMKRISGQRVPTSRWHFVVIFVDICMALVVMFLSFHATEIVCIGYNS